ncbi:uncharacterized protein LAESUDRAFT_513436 [Laetiporus sulphureus 93-53]|uniref:Uncharacterized protein n=1 Tax=Laetiporus sulphureus 93-53 TaxID=1314785 RepID=A0A165FZB4_9APHY|nr:uncharacterized protein LAESUDRAFT_513436 [Laetiporus sulphureus 93-53]KZT09613.1 hypothetical protein LAESUDRAFT_513436 [Laetiporus sulphureus 93-53]
MIWQLIVPRTLRAMNCIVRISQEMKNGAWHRRASVSPWACHCTGLGLVSGVYISTLTLIQRVPFASLGFPRNCLHPICTLCQFAPRCRH